MASEDLPANGHGGPADPKVHLRRTLRAARKAYVAGLTEAEREQQQAALVRHLARHLPRGRIAGYRAVGSEIAVDSLLPSLLLPRVVADAALEFCDDGGRRLRPAVVLLPLLAVDRCGTRLGQGGGHYDRTLAVLRTAGRVLAVGCAWDVQLVDVLPSDDWDEPLDALATPSQWLTFPLRRPMPPQ